MRGALNGVMNSDIKRQIGINSGRIWSISWERKARRYLKSLRDNFEIISYREASEILGLTHNRVRQMHHLCACRGGLGKCACMKVTLRGYYNLDTGRFKGLVKEDVLNLKKMREEACQTRLS